MQLTKNFKLEEFGKNLNTYQVHLIQTLARELQHVRDWLNSDECKEFKVKKTKEITMTITSGVRTYDDYNRLLSKGYNPSPTSDHFCGVSITGAPTLGAADVVLGNFNGEYKKLFKKLCDNVNFDFYFGQVILEYNPSTKYYWIHFGNDPYQIFTTNLADEIKRRQFLTSTDNGKTYKEFKV